MEAITFPCNTAPAKLSLRTGILAAWMPSAFGDSLCVIHDRNSRIKSHQGFLQSCEFRHRYENGFGGKYSHYAMDTDHAEYLWSLDSAACPLDWFRLASSETRFMEEDIREKRSGQRNKSPSLL